MRAFPKCVTSRVWLHRVTERYKHTHTHTVFFREEGAPCDNECTHEIASPSQNIKFTSEAVVSRMTPVTLSGHIVP